MTYFSGFTSHQLCYANFKRINCGFEETKPSPVENNTKTENSGFFISRQNGLNTCSYPIFLIKTSSQNSKTRVSYIVFQNNGFAALRDGNKVFRLSKNTFIDKFSFIANWKRSFSSFCYGKQTFLAPKLMIVAWDSVSENWQSAAGNQKWSSLEVN